MTHMKEGDKSRAICDDDGLVETTMQYRNVPFDDGTRIVDNILVGVCDNCNEVVSIPQQSVDSISKCRLREYPHITDAHVLLENLKKSFIKPKDYIPFIDRELTYSLLTIDDIIKNKLFDTVLHSGDGVTHITEDLKTEFTSIIANKIVELPKHDQEELLIQSFILREDQIRYWYLSSCLDSLLKKEFDPKSNTNGKFLTDSTKLLISCFNIDPKLDVTAKHFSSIIKKYFNSVEGIILCMNFNLKKEYAQVTDKIYSMHKATQLKNILT